MVSIHNCFIRAINSAYNQAPYVRQQSDMLDLAQFIKYWAESLHNHHDSEERVGFPQFVEVSKGEWAGELKQNSEQHRLFDQKVANLVAWCDDVTEGESWTRELGKRIEAVMDILHQHLKDEIPTLLKLEKYPAKSIEDAVKVYMKAVDSKADMAIEGPLCLGGHDCTFPGGKGAFENLPWFVPYLNYYWFERGRTNVWRFSPSDSWSRPRKLCFGPE